MPNLYLNHLFDIADTCNLQREPRDRFKNFYRDLHRTNDAGEIDDVTYHQGDQLSWTILGDRLLTACKKIGLLNQLDLLIIASWTPEFDTDASCGAYFNHEYQLTAAILDVLDNGILAPITALKIIQSYFAVRKCNNALLLCFDQNTIPRTKKFTGYLPIASGAAAFYFTSNRQSTTKSEINAINIDPNPIIKKIPTQERVLQNCANILLPLGHSPRGEYHLSLCDVESAASATINFKVI